MEQEASVKQVIIKNKSLGRKLLTCSRGFAMWLRTGKYIVIPSVVTISTTWIFGARWNLLMPIVVLNVTLVVAEILNTSIEKICDKINGHMDHDIKVIKDISSSSVLVVGLALLGIWLWVLVDSIARYY